MTINKFFDKIIYIGKDDKAGQNVKKQLTKFRINFDTVFPFDPNHQILPRSSLLTKEDLAELLTYYNVIKQANADRLSRIFILSGNLKLKNLPEAFETFSEQTPSKFDLVYFGYDGAYIKSAEKKETLVEPVHYAIGNFALAVNFSFFHLFLSGAVIPLYNLDEHIRAISPMTDLFVLSPPAIVRA